MATFSDRELVQYVPIDHHALFWQRFWDKVHPNEQDSDHPEAPLTPQLADSLWANRTVEEAASCGWWKWTGALHRVGSVKHNRDAARGAVYGYLITHGKGYHAHRLVWSYFAGKDVPHHFRVRRESHCRMFTVGMEFNQLCMWPGCLRLERMAGVPPIDEAYSVRLVDEDLRMPWYQDYERIAGIWQMVGYSKERPRYVELED